MKTRKIYQALIGFIDDSRHIEDYYQDYLPANYDSFQSTKYGRVIKTIEQFIAVLEAIALNILVSAHEAYFDARALIIDQSFYRGKKFVYRQSVDVVDLLSTLKFRYEETDFERYLAEAIFYQREEDGDIIEIDDYCARKEAFFRYLLHNPELDYLKAQLYKDLEQVSPDYFAYLSSRPGKGYSYNFYDLDFDDNYVWKAPSPTWFWNWLAEHVDIE